jgi:hypothetical protein
MRKRIISPAPHSDRQWLDIEDLVEVEVTSEDPAYPIESALQPAETTGWRAAEPGKQIIRLLFARPQPLRQICLKFIEPDVERTQEYVLHYSSAGQPALREIVRQQWNFSSMGATCEIEDHQVELSNVTVLELSINPDVSGGQAIASLSQFRIA